MGLLELRKEMFWAISASVRLFRGAPRLELLRSSTIRATMPMAIALSHPQSKKYFIRTIQMNNTINPAIRPTMKISSKSAMTVPRIEIQRASVNFAFSFPASHLHAIHSTGESTIMPITTCTQDLSRMRPDSTPCLFPSKTHS